MNHTLLSLALLVALALGAGGAAAQTPLYLLDSDEATFVDLYRVDRTTGQLTQLGSLPGNIGAIVTLAAVDANLLYAISQGGEVLEIRTNPFGFTSIGNIGSNALVGMAFSEGALYAIEEGTNSLYRIGLAPLSAAVVGTVRRPDASILGITGGDLARSGAGDWYLWTNATQALYRLDVATAVATPVPAQQTELGFTTGLAFDYQGGDALLGSSGVLDALRTLDLASGAPVAAVTLCLACPAPFNVSFGDMASPRPELPCPDEKGFWRNSDPAIWPVTSLVLGSRTYTQAALRSLLDRGVGGDASLSLAQQLIAAKLNVASGSDPVPAAASIAAGDALLAPFTGVLPYRIASSSAAGRAMTPVANALDAYNRGTLTPFCAR